LDDSSILEMLDRQTSPASVSSRKDKPLHVGSESHIDLRDPTRLWWQAKDGETAEQVRLCDGLTTASEHV
jgi:hypothetical protein